MIILGGKRACGKSTELVKISHINNIPIIVIDHARANVLKNIAKKEGIKIPEPIVYKNYDRYVIGKKINEILIDDVEDILQRIFDYSRIVIITTSKQFVPLDFNNNNNKDLTKIISKEI